MIERKYRDLAEAKYLARSKKYLEATNKAKELQNLVTNYLQETLTEEAIKYSIKYPDRVNIQDNLDFEYELSCSWSYRHLISNMMKVNLKGLGLPRLYPSVSTIFDTESEFYKEHKAFCKKLIKLIKEISDIIKEVGPEVDALESALSEKSMNKTSIQKFYPELYELIYD